MRISLINVNLVAHDAIGQCIINQWRFFTQRGDDVAIFVEHPPVGVDAEVAAAVRVVGSDVLVHRMDTHFSTSALYVYHYPAYYSLMDSMVILDRGSVIFYFHNVTPPALWDNPDDHALLQRSLEAVRTYAKSADLVVTDSAFNSQDLVSAHGCADERIRVLPLTVPVDLFRSKPKPVELVEKYGLAGHKVLLFVGRQASNKRIDILVQTLAEVQKSIHDVKLLVVGDYSGNEALRQTHDKVLALAAELGVQDDVIFTGRVDDLVSHYHLADIYVTASQHEGFGVPLIEAMASGTPVVASNMTAHPWVLGDAGILVEGCEPQDYASAILSVLGDAELYGSLVKKSAQRVKAFTLERYEAGWYDIVSELVAWMPMEGYARTASVESTAIPKETDLFAYGDVRVGDALSLAGLRDSAFNMHLGFHQTSKIPILGKLIVWLRQNLTSHVKAEYEPLFRAQFDLNRQMVRVFYALQTLLGNQSASQHASIAAQQNSIDVLSRHLTLMANEIQLMQLRLTLLQTQNQGQVDDQTLADLQRDMSQLTKSYTTLRESLGDVPVADTKED